MRDEDGGIRRYGHIGTGNYNPKTAQLYEDVGLLTADPTSTADVADVFNSSPATAASTSTGTCSWRPPACARELLELIRDAGRAGRKGGS